LSSSFFGLEALGRLGGLKDFGCPARLDLTSPGKTAQASNLGPALGAEDRPRAPTEGYGGGELHLPQASACGARCQAVFEAPTPQASPRMPVKRPRWPWVASWGWKRPCGCPGDSGRG